MSRRSAVHVFASVAIMIQSVAPALAADNLNFKIYSPPAETQNNAAGSSSSEGSFWSEGSSSSTPKPDSGSTTAAPAEAAAPEATPAAAESAASSSAASAADPAKSEAAATETSSTSTTPAAPDGTATASNEGTRLQGYIRVVPSGTKIPIIMDSAVDSDTSQEGDEFAARTSEDLLIDGSTIVPAGSVIKGRIAQLNNPKHLNRSGSVALKFDTVTTPDNRQIPLVANLVARGGVVHARRGLKDVAIDTGTFALPTALGVGIGALAGNASDSSSLGMAGGALIGAGIGAAVGVIVLCAKKGKKVDVRPGDELKIELAEDLRMPM
ncbi:MAG: hypothetical protein K2W95_03825 [Candidatus Obscuribacterales bacterium]|nr:hypothetical protein [Candidatus Obscuribacterales bacterium]